jgi:hypothetical protein
LILLSWLGCKRIDEDSLVFIWTWSYTNVAVTDKQYDYRRLGLPRTQPPSHALNALTTANHVVLKRMYVPFLVLMHNGFGNVAGCQTVLLLVHRRLWRDQRRSNIHTMTYWVLMIVCHCLFPLIAARRSFRTSGMNGLTHYPIIG